MFNTAIYLLVLNLIVAHGRVAVKDETLPDISNNDVIDTDKLNTSSVEIHIDLPTVKPNEDNATTNSAVISEANADIKLDNMTVIDIKDNTIDDSKENEVLPEEDSGVVLKLTQFIKENHLKEARSAAKVNKPDIFLGVESYTGFFTVNETYDSNLFFWYFPVENKPVNETPWIIWLQGGPGASSMTGLFDEIGPFTVLPNNTLTRNPFSWLRDHSLLFIDNPVGTGHSFTTSEDGYVKDMETYGVHLFSAVTQFLQIFPELKSAPLYIAGESYAGKYVPALAINIHRQKQHYDINLQGLITGNAYVDPEMINNIERPFYNHGLLEMEQIAQLRPLLDAMRRDIEVKDSIAAKNRWVQLIYVLLAVTHQQHMYNYLRDDMLVGRYVGLLDKPEIKKAIHTGGINLSHVNITVNKKLSGEFLTSAKWMYEELLDHYRVLTYCGQLDLMLSCVATSENYRTWKWGGAGEFINATRHPFAYNNRLAGYHKTGGNLTEVVVRGAGHMAPIDKPGPTQKLVATWTHGGSLGKSPIMEGSYIQEAINRSLSYHVYL